VQTRADHFRVPDVCVVTERPDGEPGHRIVTHSPYFCIEILSPEDKAVETLEKVREYLRFGVTWVWVIDPVSLTGQALRTVSFPRTASASISLRQSFRRTRPRPRVPLFVMIVFAVVIAITVAVAVVIVANRSTLAFPATFEKALAIVAGAYPDRTLIGRTSPISVMPSVTVSDGVLVTFDPDIT
jgi:hypothetical protein